jgi:4-amino-4-deoxy-L-arabinose transferase-like glycosyltransferase
MRKSIWVLIILGILIFSAYIPLNNKGAADDHQLSRNSVDESFQYPFLIHMITPGQTASETRWRLISYGHYIYGYPFYVASALAAAPIQMMYGAETESQVQLIVLVERQMVSVLPMLLAIGIFTYLSTRFRSPVTSAAVFLFLCTIPGIVRQNIWWWHPDALTILCVALTFFFLDRDASRFGRNFYLAAVFCGLAIGIKSIGVFFAPVIAYVLIAGLIQKKITFKKALIAGFGFICVMIASIFISNPLLFIPAARDRIIQIHVDHNYFFTHGWADSDPYGVGWAAWQPVLNGWYAPFVFLAFALAAHGFNAAWGKIKEISRLYLAWIIPFSLYVIYIIAVKPDHYWMPVMLPLFAGVFPMVENLWSEFKVYRKTDTDKALLCLAGALIMMIVLITQVVFNLGTSWEVIANVL